MPVNPLLTQLPRGVALKDPILLASGCCGYGTEYASILDPREIGGIITKAVSMEARDGNATPRLKETPAGLLNCIGLQNPGAHKFCEEYLPVIIEGGFSYLVNVVGSSPQAFWDVLSFIDKHIASLGDAGQFCGYELDLSCPNVKSGTMFATDERLLEETVTGCRHLTDRMLVAKLSPNVTDIVPLAETAVRAGADALTVANTFNGMSIDIRSRKSHLSRPSAGLSGAAIRPATLYHVWRCHLGVPTVPIIASGGITDADSAVQYLLAGATALQIGTSLFVDPESPLKVKTGIAAYLESQGESSVADIIGTFEG